MILVIDKSKKNAASLADMFYYMGAVAVAKTPSEALSEISPIYRAIIITNPNLLADKVDFMQRLRSYASGIPAFALTDEPDDYDMVIFEKTLPNDIYGAPLFSEITSYTEKHRLPSPGVYRLAGIDASASLSAPTCFGIPMAFTKTECMIIRVLIRTYPIPTKPKKILEYAFREAKIPDISNVRTHISIINKKFRELSGRNLIEMKLGEGYLIYTPKLKEYERQSKDKIKA